MREMRLRETNDKVERLAEISACLACEGQVHESKQEKPWQVSSQRFFPSAPTRS